MPYNTKQITRACISKYNHERDNQVILLMIIDGKKQHYLALKSLQTFNEKRKKYNLARKSLSRLLRGISSNHNGDFYCLNCFCLYSTEKRPEKHEKECFDHDNCPVEMPDEGNKLLKYNHREKSLKAPFMIYADLECLLEKMHSCQNNLKKSYIEKKS